VALDYNPRSRIHARTGLPRLHGEARLQPRWRMPVLRTSRRPGDTRTRERMLKELAHLPPPRQGPVLQAGRAVPMRPVAERRVQPREPLFTRLVAGEFQRRLMLVLAGVTLFVVVVLLLGVSLFG
jgi:hypothetical protein